VTHGVIEARRSDVIETQAIEAHDDAESTVSADPT
jgi:hypothetical protein